MSIPDPTIRRLLREHFSGASPIRVTTDQRADWATQIRQRLAGMKYVEAERNTYYMDQREQDRFICTFSLNEPSDFRYYSRSTNFTIKTNERSQLTIAHWKNAALVSSLDEIVAFVVACQEAVDRKIAQKSRRQKVRDLKAQAIVAQVKKIAKEDKFDFYTETDTQKLTLYVSLSDKESVELQVPFPKFEEVLPHLRTSIQAVRELYARGIKFKISQFSPSSWRSQSWIRHETL
ncbi:MAG: hypothetical protein DYG89_41350 [Caldilinea sp. CFX5]|nr:hypothetical protein [Caldilinea sp. CFX5]